MHSHTNILDIAHCRAPRYEQESAVRRSKIKRVNIVLAVFVVRVVYVQLQVKNVTRQKLVETSCKTEDMLEEMKTTVKCIAQQKIDI